MKEKKEKRLEEAPVADKIQCCFWCGKHKVSGRWSGNQRKYCSLRCAAAGEHRNAVFVMIISAPFTFLFLIFPDFMYSMLLKYLGGNYSPGSNPPLLSLIVVGGIILVLFSMTTLSSYMSFIGWSIRRNTGVAYIGEFEDSQKYPKHEQYGKTMILCAVCGNPQISTFWSNSRGHFCSFKCSAAQDYMRFLGMAITVLTLLFILVIMTVMMPIRQPSTNPIPIIIAAPITFIVLLDLGFFYATYIGWKMNQKLRSEDYVG